MLKIGEEGLLYLFQSLKFFNLSVLEACPDVGY